MFFALALFAGLRAPEPVARAGADAAAWLTAVAVGAWLAYLLFRSAADLVNTWRAGFKAAFRNGENG